MSTKQLVHEGRQFLELLRLKGFRSMTPFARVWAIACVLMITHPIWLGVLFYSGAWRWLV